MTTRQELEARARELGCLSDAFMRLLDIIDWCDKTDAELEALKRGKG